MTAADYPPHPLAEQYPMMSEGELLMMAADMKAHGFDREHPVLVFEGMILDGRNRYRAARMAGVEPYCTQYVGTPDDARAYVVRSNELRRMLTPAYLEQKRQERAGLAAELRAGGDSLRTIAQKTGVSKSQVRKDLKGAAPAAADAGGHPVSTCPESIKGKDGKTYSAAAAAREPGDDTDVVEAAKRLPRPGQPAYSMKEFHSHYGALVRQIDAMNNAFGAKDGPESEGLRRMLAEFRGSFEARHKCLKKTGGR